MHKRSNPTPKILLGILILVLCAIGFYNIPYVHSKLAWRLDNLRLSIIYFFEPPQKVVFHPTEQALPSPTPYQIINTPTATIIPTDLATPTVTATPPPPSVILANIPFVDQSNRYNYCGPANLAMALEYWGWKGNAGSTMEPRDQIAAIVKPGENDPNKNFIDRGNTDVNVMPYEMVDFVNSTTNFKALLRHGGDADLLKRLISAGFPVITE
jgi:hypothetical protein